MFVLNLALSNCALSRELMSEELEKNMKKCGGMASVRKLAASSQGADVVTPPTIIRHSLLLLLKMRLLLLVILLLKFV